MRANPPPLARLGQIDLGESRVQSLEIRQAAFAREGLDVRWHLLGHLQRNKARRAATLCHSVHSLDSRDLLDSLSRHVLELNASPELYVEVDYVGGGARTGLTEDRVPEFVEAMGRAPHLRLCGLMTIAPVPEFDGDTRRARAVFARLRELSRRLPAEAFCDGKPRLSMGMSSDFEIAIEEGSDCVRIGSALFHSEESRP